MCSVVDEETHVVLQGEGDGRGKVWGVYGGHNWYSIAGFDITCVNGE